MTVRPWAYPIAVVMSMLVLVAALVFLTLRIDRQLESLDPPPVPVTVSARPASADFAAEATLKFDVHSPEAVLWNTSTGTVTAVHVGDGDVLTSGSPVVDVDGIPRIAYWSPTAFFRPLSRGMSGADVEWAQVVLNEILPELNLPRTGVFGRETREAVRAFERWLGLPRPTGVLDPEWFLRLPEPEFPVAEVHLRVGQPTPSAGDPTIESSPQVQAVELTSDSTGPDGQYTFTYQGETHEFRRTGDQWEPLDSGVLAALLHQGKGSDLPETTFSGQVALSAPIAAQAVPPASLVSNSAGTHCVIR